MSKCYNLEVVNVAFDCCFFLYCLALAGDPSLKVGGKRNVKLLQETPTRLHNRCVTAVIVPMKC